MADTDPVQLPVRLPNGNILAPRRAEGSGGLVGDGAEELRPGDPGFAAWDEWMRTPSMGPAD